MPGEWEKTGPASFQADGSPEIRFIVVGVRKKGGKRLAKRRRPYRPGAKLDNVGRLEREWDLDISFFNTVDEPNMGTDVQHWPDRANDLEAAAEADETGTLHLPWERNLRGQIETFERVYDTGKRDGEIFRFHFVEDTEEQLLGDAVDQVSVKAQIQRKVEEAEFDAESLGDWDGSFEDFQEFAADLEGALNAPGQALDDVKHKAGRVRRAAKSVKESITSRVDGDDPEHERVLRKMNAISDTAAGVEIQASANSPRTRTVSYATATDIYSIAADLGQDAGELISLNTSIEDLLAIPAGTAVVVFA
jgi:prophage DNA circulation protein